MIWTRLSSCWLKSVVTASLARMTSFGLALAVFQRASSLAVVLQSIHHGLKKVLVPGISFRFDSGVMKRQSIWPAGRRVLTGVPRNARRTSGFEEIWFQSRFWLRIVVPSLSFALPPADTSLLRLSA